MGGVDHRVDALFDKIRGQTIGAAEAANPQRDRRRRRIGRRTGERQNRRYLRFNGDPPRKRACFGGAAENEQAKALQGAAP
jgi:hypothetical protein